MGSDGGEAERGKDGRIPWGGGVCSDGGAFWEGGFVCVGWILSIYLCIYLLIYIFIYNFIYILICLFVYLFDFVYLIVCLLFGLKLLV